MTQTASMSTVDPVIHRTLGLLEHLFLTPRPFGIRVWDGTELPVDGRRTFSLVLNDPSALRREEAIHASDEVTYRTWRLYMSASAFGFESGNINVNQTLLAKMTREGKSSVPFSRADLYIV